MRDMDTACEAFFRLPAEDKAAFYSEDTARPNRLFSSTVYGSGGERYRRDCLRLACGSFSVSDSTRNAWPDKPDGIRYGTVERLMELRRLLCEGMGLRADHFDGDLSGGDVIMNVNHCPSCPEPLRTLGLPSYCDRNLIILLRQGTVPGVQVSHPGGGGGWFGVEPVPGAFVVNFGHQLEIATNGVHRSVEHRAVPDAARPRTSVATFLVPTEDCIVDPAEEIVDAGGEGRPRYRAVTFREFMEVYRAVDARREGVEKAFRIW